MPDIHVREIKLSEEQRIQRHMSTDKIRFNWESLPTVGFIGLVLSVALVVLARCCWEFDIGILSTMAVGGILGTGLGFYNERRRQALMPKEERRWHSDYIALYEEIERFSERLEAFRQLALTYDTFEGPRDVGSALIGKYLSDRDSLTDRMRVFLRDMAFKRFEAAVAKNADGRYRDTRDVTEEVFVRRVRVSQEEAEINTLLASGTPESPNEDLFRELEEEYGNDVPASKPVRRIS